MSDIDSVDEESDYVLLMTLHSAKGLEFPNVFLAGMEDGIFPSYMTITGDDPSELEEERRLCYVGITRAMQHLTLTCARQRMIRGEVQYNKMSRFVKEIPRELISLERERGEIEDRKPKMDIPTRGSVYAAMKQAFREKPQQAKTFSAQKRRNSITKSEIRCAISSSVSALSRISWTAEEIMKLPSTSTRLVRRKCLLRLQN